MFPTLLLLLFKSILISNSEIAYPKDYFVAPIDGTLLLAGNFGELRTNHFHSGIDIKTDGQVGKKIYAAAEGEVVRIKISSTGYGKAIYIMHPNGFTTVYAHMQKFIPKIEDLIRKEQYKLKNYEVDFILGSDAVPLVKHQWIGLSGNTGSSGGPHLHFEIRNTATEEALNPLLFGLNVFDNLTPLIKGIRIYPMTDSSFIDGYNQPKSFNALLPKGAKNDYIISKKDTILLCGNVGFAVNSLDKINNATSRCGIYSIKLEVDKTTIYEDRLEKINFDTWRYVNAYTDYELFNRKKMNYYKCFVKGNNKLNIYKTLVNKGQVEFNLNKIYQIKYTIKDVYGNASTLVFNVKGTSKVPPLEQVLKTTTDKYFFYEKENFFYNDNLKVKIPPNALYDNLEFNCTEMAEKNISLSPVWAVQNEYVPLQNSIEIKIKTDVSYKAKTSQLGIVQVFESNKPKWIGGKFSNGEITASTKNFGVYCIMADTVAPTIAPVLDKKKNMILNNIVTFKIKDDFSGIKNYNITIDGKWVVAEYDFKSNAIYCHLENLGLLKGNHKIEVSTEDAAENLTNYSNDFTIY